MGVGHAAVALGAGRLVPRLNVGWLVLAALLADFLLGVFAFLGLERAEVPADYAARHYLFFTFPYSHGLLPLAVWASVFAFLISRGSAEARGRVFAVATAVVLSHFLLDGLVHVVGLPLAGENSPKIGLGLWKNMPAELALETAMTIAGVVVYLRTARAGGSATSRLGMPIFMVLFTLMTWTQLFAVEPPPTNALIVSWLVAPLVLSAIAYLLDRKRTRLAVSHAV
jgi:hypothetical protein